MLSQQLKVYTKDIILSYTKMRRFETKIGEVIQTVSDANNIEQSIAETSATFVIIGVPEDIGIKANGGEDVAGSAWTSFLHSFLNIQSNDFFEGTEVLLLGHLSFAGVGEVIDSNAGNPEERTEAYRHSVKAVDDAVEVLVRTVTSYRKIPVVISGGHNNAYGCIKGAAKGWHKAGVTQLAQINAINLDANSEYKPLEGRHSANAIRYAEEDGYLQKYCVIGLHENELPQNAWLDIANNPFFDFVTYEDIFIHGKQTYMEAVHHAISFTSDTLCGVELDMEIFGVNSNMQSAVSVALGRKYIHLAAVEAQPAYLLISEAANRIKGLYNATASGELISYLVSDFIKVIG